MATTVLVPLDGSPLAEQALAHAENLARRSAARLLLLHVAPDGDGPRAARGPRAPRASLAYLDAVATRLAGRSIQAEVASYAEQPAAATMHLARLLRVDVVVLAVGSRLSAGWRQFGSLADRLLRHGRVPVLLVPAPDPADRDDRVLDVTWRPAPFELGRAGAAERGVTQISSPNNSVLVLGRVLVYSDSDLAAAYGLAQQIQLAPLGQK